MEKEDKIQCYCYSCKQETWHDVIAKTEESSDEDYWWHTRFYLVKCCGCESVAFLTESEEESDVDYDEYGNMTLNITQKTYPVQKPIADKITDTWYIPSKISKIYNETLEALNRKCFLLAAAGFRVLVEAICVDQNIDGKSLETKINNLCKKGIITHNDRDRLHTIRFMGNDSVHSVVESSKDQLLLVLDIIHNMLNNLYILTEKCNCLLKTPIKTFLDFCKLLDEGLAKRKAGDIDILRNILPKTRLLIQEDRIKFEAELCNKINAGEYTKLKLCPAPENGKNQQYQIL